jgi:branched-chain amino acid transport system ATP-binding protein
VPLLSVVDVTVRFGGVLALDRVSLDVDRGQIAGLIGPNGAGKTTLFDVITRLSEPAAGDVSFRGDSLLGTRRHDIARLGIARTFQNVEAFSTLTPLESLLVGGRVDRPRALRLLEYVGLRGVAGQPVSTLPFGTQKRVDLARALALEPSLLLLDEPAGGLAHEEVEQLGDFLRRMCGDFELTVLVVEHHMGLVMALCNRVHVLNFGRIIATGAPAEVRGHQAVVDAYLGTPLAAARA